MKDQLNKVTQEVHQIMNNVRIGEVHNNALLASIHDRLDMLQDSIDKVGSDLRIFFVSFFEAVENFGNTPSSPALQYVDQTAHEMLNELKRLTSLCQ